MNDSTELLRQEVTELTDMLRSGDGFNALRNALIARKIPVDKTIFAGFMENEDEDEYGVIITHELKCIAWEADRHESITRWETISDPDSLAGEFEALPVGISMVRSGEIS